jgi:formate/nitrite transporter FocA (FNT family)
VVVAAVLAEQFEAAMAALVHRWPRMDASVPTAGESHLSEDEAFAHRKIKQRQALSAAAVNETLRLEGKTELDRSSQALAWSALAAGLSIGLSMIAEAALRLHAPEAPWRPLFVSLGYTVGFVVVTFGRQQLYTETTLTALLPVFHDRSAALFKSTLRLWVVVLLGNLAGAFLFAWAAAATPAFSPEFRDMFGQLGHEVIRHDPWTAFIKGIFGGWLIALMVWLLPSAEAARIWIIVVMTYLLSVTQLTHIIAGSVEAFYLIITGELSTFDYLWRYGAPVLIGNTIGGVVLVTALNHVQVATE